MMQKSGSEKQPAQGHSAGGASTLWAREEDSRRAGGASREGALPNEQTMIFRGRYPTG
jgi:hypothetical protein